jgi:AraC-like DNA-binding protein/mannose-6-phosphate isomerase-like protein (cupin superfamily)
MKTDITGPKYWIGERFSIQHIRRFGKSSMPRPHSHPTYELYYLLSGERIYFVDGHVYTARQGQLVIIPPNELHSTASSEKAEFERILVNFLPEYICEGGASTGLPPIPGTCRIIDFSLKEQADAERLLSRMLEECKAGAAYYETSVRLLLSELLILLERCRLFNPEPPRSLHPTHAKVSEIAAFLRLHYSEPLTLEQMSRQFYISTSHLCRIFYRLTGFHFREYLQEVRVREAQKRLAGTRDKVQAIAEQTGFEHISHFNKTFKKVTGLTPLQYRKQNRSRPSP